MIKPTKDGILVEPVEVSRHETLYVPQATTTFTQSGKPEAQNTVGRVLATGPGKYNKKGQRRPPDVPVGAFVTYSDSMGSRQFEVEGKRYCVIPEASIVGILDEPEHWEVING